MKKFKRGGAPSYTMDVNYDPNQLGGYFPEYIDPSVGLFGGTPQTYRERQWADEAARRAATSARRDILDELGEPYYTPEQRAKLDEEAEKRAEEEKEQSLLENIKTAEDFLEGLYRKRDVVLDPETGEKVYKNTGLSVKDTPFDIDAYFAEVAGAREAVRQARQAARDAGLNIPGDGPLDAVGTLLSRASRYTGIPLPDLTTIGAGGATFTWGVPEGKPVGAVTLPGTAGSTVTGGAARAGVRTGNPVIDLILSGVEQVDDGQGGVTYRYPSMEEILEILRQKGLNEKTGLTGEEEEEEDPKVVIGGGLDGGGGETPDDPNKRRPVSPDRPNPNRVLTRTGGTPNGDPNKKTDGVTPIDDEDEYLDLNKTTTSNETTDEDKESDETSGGGGGGGAGYTQGIEAVTGEPGPTVDIDYLYDIAGESIFNPAMGKTEEEKEDKKNKRGPYVYANMGGMIRNNYDLTDEILRLLRRR